MQLKVKEAAARSINKRHAGAAPNGWATREREWPAESRSDLVVAGGGGTAGKTLLPRVAGGLLKELLQAIQNGDIVLSSFAGLICVRGRPCALRSGLGTPECRRHRQFPVTLSQVLLSVSLNAFTDGARCRERKDDSTPFISSINMSTSTLASLPRTITSKKVVLTRNSHKGLDGCITRTQTKLIAYSVMQ